MEQTDYTHFDTKEAAEWSTAHLRSLGWSAKVAAEADEDGWLVTAQFDDGVDDGGWTVSRGKAWADKTASGMARPRSRKCEAEASEHRQVGVEPNALDAPHAEEGELLS